MKQEITSKDSYQETIIAIFKLRGKGEANLIPEELNALSAMAVAVEEYEKVASGLTMVVLTP